MAVTLPHCLTYRRTTIKYLTATMISAQAATVRRRQMDFLDGYYGSS